MSCFSTVSAVTANSELDLTKHVNYTSGMILGVDDFTQEFAYLAGRDRWLARDALGYGTISGLKVQIEEDEEKGFRVLIQPGVAVSPRGQFICVPAAQCAYLNQWLAAADPKDLKKWVKLGNTSPPVSPPIGDELTLYVTLCYRDCLNDNMPIPGEPCRSEEELTAASRVKDDFSLELRFEPPMQPEENAVRKYVEWLKQITIIETGNSTPIDDFIKAIRDEWLVPKASPPITSPPPVLQILTDDFCDYIRTAFRLWVTELRNILSERKTGCAVEMTGGNNIEDCILLAELDIPLVSISSGWKVSDAKKIEQNEEKRPFLIHLRMLQEWMLCGSRQTSGNSPSPTEPTVHNHSLNTLSDVSAASPDIGDTLIFEDGKWNSKPPVIGEGNVTDHAALTGLRNDDHQQYLLADGSRALTDKLIGGGNQITNLAAATENGQAVIFEQAIKDGDPAGGDLTGTYPNPTINLLQGHPVQASPQNIGDRLVWDGTAWIAQPQTTPTNQTEPFLILPLATITRVEEKDPRTGAVTSFFYEVWFNIDAPGNLAEIKDLPLIAGKHLKIFDETEFDTGLPAERQTFRREIKEFSIKKSLIRNVFVVRFTVPEPDRMRFDFNVREIVVQFKGAEPKLISYAEETRIKFAGFLKAEFATIFVRGLGKA